MKATRILIALSLFAASSLSAQDAAHNGEDDLLFLFQKMYHDGASDEDLRKLLDERLSHRLTSPGTPPEEASATPTSSSRWQLGLAVEPLPPYVAEHLGLAEAAGVRVAHVAPGSPAERVGLAVNDIIHAAGGKPVSSIDDLRAAVEAAGRDHLPLTIAWIHRGERKSAEATPDGPPPTAVRRSTRAPQIQRIAELARRLEAQQQEIEALRRELGALKEESGE